MGGDHNKIVKEQQQLKLMQGLISHFEFIKMWSS